MHEMAIVQSIMEIVEEEARRHHAKRVACVSLEFGALTGVLPTAVEFAFEVLSKDTIAEGATLTIAIIPVKVKCCECGVETFMDDYDPFCPKCASPALTFLQGRHEMRVASLELEDDRSG